MDYFHGVLPTTLLSCLCLAVAECNPAFQEICWLGHMWTAVTLKIPANVLIELCFKKKTLHCCVAVTQEHTPPMCYFLQARLQNCLGYTLAQSWRLHSLHSNVLCVNATDTMSSCSLDNYNTTQVCKKWQVSLNAAFWHLWPSVNERNISNVCIDCFFDSSSPIQYQPMSLKLNNIMTTSSIVAKSQVLLLTI